VVTEIPFSLMFLSLFLPVFVNVGMNYFFAKMTFGGGHLLRKSGTCLVKRSSIS
jgi:hypothetical protein